MMGNKKLSEIRRELTELLAKLPGGPKAWFEREIQTAQGQPDRDVETLKALQSALQKHARKRRPCRTKATGSRS
jgi:hypothetical protein